MYVFKLNYKYKKVSDKYLFSIYINVWEKEITNLDVQKR